MFDGEDIGTLFPAQPRRDKKSFWLSHMVHGAQTKLNYMVHGAQIKL